MTPPPLSSFVAFSCSSLNTRKHYQGAQFWAKSALSVAPRNY